MVESPGTAPGSEPFIMGAFIAIVRVAPDRVNIGAGEGARKVVCGPSSGPFLSILYQWVGGADLTLC